MREGVLVMEAGAGIYHITYTSALTNKLEFHALNVCRLCKFVVVNQMV